MSQKQKDAPQERDKAQKPEGTPAESAEDAKAKEITKKGKKLKEDLDKLMDEIDEVLEENAEEFVKSYVQAGGE